MDMCLIVGALILFISNAYVATFCYGLGGRNEARRLLTEIKERAQGGG